MDTASFLFVWNGLNRQSSYDEMLLGDKAITMHLRRPTMTHKLLCLLLLGMASTSFTFMTSCADIEYNNGGENSDGFNNDDINNANPNNQNNINNNGITDEICDDGIDNDRDGQIDCEDTECSRLRICLSPEPEICDDGIDNDRDGNIDCNDSDCARTRVCLSLEPEICDDGIDNDGDRRVDCDDSDCFEDRRCFDDPESCFEACEQISFCIDQSPQCAERDARFFNEACQEQLCFDNQAQEVIEVANLGCGEIQDILVPQLRDQGLCTSNREICDDGVDNDGNGLIDCDDPNCSNRNICADIEPCLASCQYIVSCLTEVDECSEDSITDFHFLCRDELCNDVNTRDQVILAVEFSCQDINNILQDQGYCRP